VKSGACWKYGDGAKDGEVCPMPNRQATLPLDGNAQQRVSRRMNERVAQLKETESRPRFVVNVGDNFYPGGINLWCGKADASEELSKGQFQNAWKDVYVGYMMSIEWWSVLGNHDYGGTCYKKGWDQQIYFTWHDDQWVLPAQYWMRTVHYSTFTADFFFVDGNYYDVSPGQTPNHDMCTPAQAHCEPEFYQGGGDDCGHSGPHSVGTCKQWFADLWKSNYDWLLKKVAASTADWQIVVNHYPPNYNLGQQGSFMEWAKWLTPAGVDLYISGHEHSQRIIREKQYQKTGAIITGGGGGVTSEIIPTPGGKEESYGFMDITISLEKITIQAFSHGGAHEELFTTDTETIYPVDKEATDKEDVEEVSAVV
jgi:hypothetical protein